MQGDAYRCSLGGGCFTAGLHHVSATRRDTLVHDAQSSGDLLLFIRLSQCLRAKRKPCTTCMAELTSCLWHFDLRHPICTATSSRLASDATEAGGSPACFRVRVSPRMSGLPDLFASPRREASLSDFSRAFGPGFFFGRRASSCKGPGGDVWPAPPGPVVLVCQSLLSLSVFICFARLVARPGSCRAGSSCGCSCGHPAPSSGVR